MVQIYKAAKGRKPGPVSLANQLLTIDELDHAGMGVCRSHQPVVFVEGALPGEQVETRIIQKKSRHWQGQAVKVLQSSPERIEAFCPHINQCGGCQNQHIGQTDLLAHKQQAVAQLLSRQSGVSALPWQPPLQGDDRHYRRKARLAVDAQGKGGPSVGFRAKGSDKVVNIRQCAILTPALQSVLTPLLQAVKALKGVRAIGHISLLDADNQLQVCLRVTRDLPATDLAQLRSLAEKCKVSLLLETAPERFEYLSGERLNASYQPATGLNLTIGPNDFIQVNSAINQAMVAQALEWLDVAPGEQILDLFCGVGNFSLPLAKAGTKVVGIEGVQAMVTRARDNAQNNGLAVDFRCMDLSDSQALLSLPVKVDKVLLDPARAGALELMPVLHKLKPGAICYVSCNPATFARDIAILAEKGWRIDKINLMDMFPNTAHTELMALLKPSGATGKA
ncbi:23S rRNA (uracil(1939)-C(5))-methyltransferase RlmD [Bowmanella denitrificans]|uniref:23S rRNA (Uracil(1939)-C(5))-methyltransferase RlmD n=1 Tax=Bowmanella denitrificans TaxID=366582 RepID=A0ABN0WMS7_9ALTE